MRNQNLLNTDDLQIEPITDQVLNDVLGGLGEEDGIFQSCSTSDCSNTKEREQIAAE